MKRKKRVKYKLNSVKATIGELKGSREANKSGKGPHIKLPRRSKKKLKKMRQKRRTLKRRLRGL